MLVYILQWWNLAFELPFLTALLYTILMSAGVGNSGEAEHDVGVDHDVGIDNDVDHDLDHGIEQITAHDHELVPTHPQGGELVRALSFLGFGRIPLSLVLTTFLYIFGFAGWAGNMVLAGTVLPPEIYFWVSMFLAMTSSVFLTRTFAIRLSKLLPKYESFGITSLEDLVGYTGEVTNQITATFGTANVHDNIGNLHEVICRVPPGEKPIPFGSHVLLTGYDPGRRIFSVLEQKDLLE